LVIRLSASVLVSQIKPGELTDGQAVVTASPTTVNGRFASQIRLPTPTSSSSA
jgi:hypothetical protein